MGKAINLIKSAQEVATNGEKKNEKKSGWKKEDALMPLLALSIGVHEASTVGGLMKQKGLQSAITKR